MEGDYYAEIITDNGESYEVIIYSDIDEIKNVTYRCLLKNKLGIPRTEKDNKKLQEFQDAINNCLSMSADEMLCSGMYDEVYNKKFVDKWW